MSIRPTCGDVEFGACVVDCACGLRRQTDRPCCYRATGNAVAMVGPTSTCATRGKFESCPVHAPRDPSIIDMAKLGYEGTREERECKDCCRKIVNGRADRCPRCEGKLLGSWVKEKQDTIKELRSNWVRIKRPTPATDVERFGLEAPELIGRVVDRKDGKATVKCAAPNGEIECVVPEHLCEPIHIADVAVRYNNEALREKIMRDWKQWETDRKTSADVDRERERANRAADDAGSALRANGELAAKIDGMEDEKSDLESQLRGARRRIQTLEATILRMKGRPA